MKGTQRYSGNIFRLNTALFIFVAIFLISKVLKAVEAAQVPTRSICVFWKNERIGGIQPTLTPTSLTSTPVFTPSPTKTPTPLPTLTTTPPAQLISCLSQLGPLITIGGNQVTRLDTRGNPIAQNSKIDARSAVWTAQWPVQDSFNYPVLIAGGPGGCFFGGEIRGTYPEEICDPPHTAGGSSCNPNDPNLPYLTWSYIHSSKALEVLLPNFTVENTRIHNYGDGIGIQAGADSFLLKGVHLSHIRDDCVENDYLQAGIIDDSLFDGCYEGFSTRPECTNCDGSNKIITIQNTLVRLEAMHGVYKNRGLIPGHDGFFKWDSNIPSQSPKLILRNNIFRADQQANNVGLGLPKGKVLECSNNIFVWLGPPTTVPQPKSDQDPITTLINGKPCFAIINDRSIWDNAVADWLTKH